MDVRVAKREENKGCGCLGPERVCGVGEGWNVCLGDWSEVVWEALVAFYGGSVADCSGLLAVKDRGIN